MKRIIQKFLSLAFIPFLIGCTPKEKQYSKDTPQNTVDGYISHRYINDYGYADFCVFKPNNCHRLIDTSMAESLKYQEEYYESIEVSDVVYAKSEDIEESVYSQYEIENDPVISQAERGVATYHWKMTPNEVGKEYGVEDIDGEYSKNLILLEIDSLWYVYIQVH